MGRGLPPVWEGNRVLLMPVISVLSYMKVMFFNKTIALLNK